MILVSAFCGPSAQNATTDRAGPDIWQQRVVEAMPSAISALVPKAWLCEDLFIAFVVVALVFGHAPGWYALDRLHPC